MPTRTSKDHGYSRPGRLINCVPQPGSLRPLALFVGLALLMMAGMAQAALSAYESFNYTAGPLANGTIATGAGFTGNWMCGTAATIGSGLSYPGLSVSNGSLSSAGGRQIVSLSTPLSSGTKWISFLFRASANGGGNVNGIFFPNGNNSCLWFGWGLSPYSPTQGGFGIGSMTTTGTAVQGATSLLAMGLGNYFSNTLVVLKIDFNTSGTNDTITIYTNPVVNASAPGVSTAGTYSAFDVGTISGVGLNVQGASSILVDEIRIGDTYGDVVGNAGTPPNPPTGVGATPGTNTVFLSWTAATGNPTSYNVKRAASFSGPYITIGTVSLPTVTYADLILGGQTYYYVVSAVNAAGESSNSFPPVSSGPFLGPPATPTGLTAIAGDLQVILNWTGGPLATSYNVQRANAAAGPYILIGTTTAPTLTYTDSVGLNNGTTYYYAVSATGSGGTSSNTPPVAATPVAPGPDVRYTLADNGPTSNHLNVVIMAEGYTTNQISQFTNDARTLANAMLSKPPYSEYTNYFNIYAIFVPSVESGSSHPNSNIVRNTYFNSTYYSSGVERLLTIPYSGGQDKMNALLADLMPEYDLACILVNDTEYGGSGGPVLVCSINSSASDVFVHEGGHTLGGLGDEYDSAYSYPDIEEPNTTTQTNRPLIKWNAWIDASTPVPTPTSYTTAMGLFLGAHYHTNGWYRPRYTCTMRTLGVSFCSVCAEQLVKSIYNYVPPISACSPATNSVVLMPTNGNIMFTVVPNLPSTHRLSIQWSTNGAAVAGATNSTFNLAASSLAIGASSLKVAVWDPTPLVRIDPNQLLTDTRDWSVAVAPAPPTLNISLISNQAVLSWPTSAVAFTLESSSSLSSGLWTSNSKPLVATGSVFKVTNNLTGSSQFFRLRK